MGHRFFFDNGEPKFSFYWTWDLVWYQSWRISSMSVDDLEVFRVLDQIVEEVDRKIVTIYMSPHHWVDLTSMYTCYFGWCQL